MNANMVLGDDTVMQREGKGRWGCKALNDDGQGGKILFESYCLKRSL